ncbi:hypothetical protein scyTo_0004944 [Scyliorhinus torazame]|uniref:Uncharacterized protein n=1 Tax=Scyliorhinus torazame TaxID=75743 RepID=A0A401NZL7_SCYTO|nr:hypothetical protein [Scyliorhinus torazame]
MWKWGNNRIGKTTFPTHFRMWKYQGDSHERTESVCVRAARSVTTLLSSFCVSLYCPGEYVSHMNHIDNKWVGKTAIVFHKAETAVIYHRLPGFQLRTDMNDLCVT